MGHAYEGVTSDAIARYARLKNGAGGCYFLTGSDEHGQKIASTAEGMGKEPIEICDKYVTGFQCLNQRTLVSNDDYLHHDTEWGTAQIYQDSLVTLALVNVYLPFHHACALS